jgi:hypothetical protein
MNLAGSITGEQDVRSPFKSTKSQVHQLLVRVCFQNRSAILSVIKLPGTCNSQVKKFLTCKNNELSDVL